MVVKHVWNVAMHVLHKILVCYKHNSLHHFGLNLLLLKSSILYHFVHTDHCCTKTESLQVQQTDNFLGGGLLVQLMDLEFCSPLNSGQCFKHFGWLSLLIG